VAVAADDQGKLPDGMLIGPALWCPAVKPFFSSFRYSGSEITRFTYMISRWLTVMNSSKLLIGCGNSCACE
jgi:hypothetical protein